MKPFENPTSSEDTETQKAAERDQIVAKVRAYVEEHLASLKRDQAVYNAEGLVNTEIEDEEKRMRRMLESMESDDYQEAYVLIEDHIENVEAAIQREEKYIEEYNTKYPITEEEWAQGVRHPNIETAKEGVVSLRKKIEELTSLRDSLIITE